MVNDRDKAKTKNQKIVDDDDDDDDDDDESINCCQLRSHQKQILRRRAKHRLDPSYEDRLRKRSCTDILCLLIFIVALAAWAVLGWFAFKDQSPGKLFAPIDSNHLKCGYDPGVEDKPYLVFFDITCLVPTGNIVKCNTPEVCVAKCPTENFYATYYIDNPKVLPIEKLASKLICQANVPLPTDYNTLKNLIQAKQCADYYLTSINVASRCLPDVSKLADVGNIKVDIDNGLGGLVNVEIPNILGGALKDGSTLVNALSAVKEFWEAIVKDLVETWPMIVACVCGTMVVSFIYIILMRWMAGIMVWFSLLACVGLLAFGCYVTFTKYDELRKLNSTEPTKYSRAVYHEVRNIVEDTIEQQWDAYMRNKDTWLVLLCICAILLAIILVILLFLRNRIRLAISLINEGSKAVGHSWTTLIFPIFPWIIQFGVVFYGVCIFLFLLSSGVPIYRVFNLAQDPSCQCDSDIPYKDGNLCIQELFNTQCHDGSGPCAIASCSIDKHDAQAYNIYFQLYNLFMFFWSLYFVSAVGQLILASTFGTYYWTFNKKDLPLFIVAQSSWRVVRYHLGTAAFGSLLLAIVTWIRAVIELAYKYCEKYADNKIVKAIKCCLSCFFWCLEKFLRFLNRNAYIMCAIKGKNFCVSAKDAFSLIVRNVLRVFVLDRVTGFLFFLSKCVIAAAVGAASFYIFSRPVLNLQDINENPYQVSYYFVPMIVVIVAAYFIATIFFSVYSMAVDTLFLCFLEDSEKNDGSAQKPYFMSKNLMSILGKKNQTR